MEMEIDELGNIQNPFYHPFGNNHISTTIRYCAQVIKFLFFYFHFSNISIELNENKNKIQFIKLI